MPHDSTLVDYEDQITRERLTCPTSYSYVSEHRRNNVLPNMLPFFDRDIPVIGEDTAKPRIDLGEYVAIENWLRNFKNRETHLHDDDGLESMVVPLALRMNYLPYGWQRSREHERWLDFSRQNIKNIHYNSSLDTNYCNYPAMHQYEWSTMPKYRPDDPNLYASYPVRQG